MALSYRLPITSSVTQERQRVTGPHVVVEQAARSGMRVELQLKFDDVRKLDTSDRFKDVQVSFDDHTKGQRTVVAVFRNRFPVTFPDEALAKLGREAKITLELPDEVIDSNGKTDGPKTVVWEMPTNDLVSVPERELRVTYRRPESEAAAAEARD